METTKIKPPQLERMQILCQYTLHTGFIDNKGKTLPFRGVDLRAGEGWHFRSDEMGVFYDVDYVCVPVKSLGGIIETDVSEICSKIGILYNGKDGYLAAVGYIQSVVDRKVSEALTCQQIQYIIDFLRFNGYALPYKNWSVDELVEFGIYKIIDK